MYCTKCIQYMYVWYQSFDMGLLEAIMTNSRAIHVYIIIQALRGSGVSKCLLLTDVAIFLIRLSSSGKHEAKHQTH